MLIHYMILAEHRFSGKVLGNGQDPKPLKLARSLEYEIFL